MTNSLAMHLAHVRADTPDPTSGRLGRYPSGRPNGQFYGPAAVQMLNNALPPVTTQDRIDAIEHLATELASYGVTTIRDVGVQR